MRREIEMGQQNLIYSFVARGTVILAEYTEFTGNFTSIASQCLQKLPATNNKFTYNCDGHTFNFLVSDGFSMLSPLLFSPPFFLWGFFPLLKWLIVWFVKLILIYRVLDLSWVFLFFSFFFFWKSVFSVVYILLGSFDLSGVFVGFEFWVVSGDFVWWVLRFGCESDVFRVFPILGVCDLSILL